MWKPELIFPEFGSHLVDVFKLTEWKRLELSENPQSVCKVTEERSKSRSSQTLIQSIYVLLLLPPNGRYICHYYTDQVSVSPAAGCVFLGAVGVKWRCDPPPARWDTTSRNWWRCLLSPAISSTKRACCTSPNARRASFVAQKVRAQMGPCTPYQFPLFVHSQIDWL